MEHFANKSDKSKIEKLKRQLRKLSYDLFDLNDAYEDLETDIDMKEKEIEAVKQQISDVRNGKYVLTHQKPKK